MQLDPRTLAVYTTAISLLLAVLGYFYGRSRRVYSGYQCWVASLLCFAMAISSIALRGLVPAWLAMIGPTALGLASLVLIGEGHRRFSDMDTPRRVPVTLALLTTVLMALVYDPQQPFQHRSIGAAGVGMVSIAVGWQFARHTPSALAGAGLCCGLLLAVFGLIRVARGGQFLLADSGFDVLAPQLSSILSYTANAVFATLWGFGFMFLSAARVETELDASRRALRELSRKDSLTGLLNRRAFFADARAELERARRYPAPLALLMIDIDNFKSVNDEHGHPAGDALLLAVSAALQAQLRDSDVLARIGGEEFAALLLQTPADEAMRVAERLRAAVAATCIAAEGVPVARTLSIGLAHDEAGKSSLEQLIRQSDAALYRAKDAGRNRVSI